jgi:hypothetical protein
MPLNAQDAAANQAANEAPRLHGYYTVRTDRSMTDADVSAAAAASGLRLFRYTATSTRDGRKYNGVIIGPSPFNHGGGTVITPAILVPLIITTHTIGTSVARNGTIATKPGTTVFNSTVASSSCLASPNNVPLKLVQQSPLFKKAGFKSGSVNLGVTQYTDAVQRAELWGLINQGTYHSLVSLRTIAPIKINVAANQGLALATTSLGPPGFCTPLGILNINSFDKLLRSKVLPALRGSGVNPSTFPIFLMANVVMASQPTNLKSCCTLGFHGSSGSPAQTYSPSNFDTTGLFGTNGRDTATLSHEVAEWMNDPFGNNPTPAWGHIGQVPGCQNNLEVGDPLSGTDLALVRMPNGFSYHLQDEAGISWFFFSPSIGANGFFSLKGTFRRDAGPVCR